MLAPSLWACSCLARSEELNFQEADFVFRGEVQETEIEGDQLWVFLKVIQSWKGNLSPSMKLQTQAEDATCGYPFKKNKQYLIYAKVKETGLWTSLCDGNIPWEESPPYLKAFKLK